MKKLTSLALALGALTFMGNALAAPPADAKLADKQEVTFNLQTFPSTTDPQLASDHYSIEVIKAMYDTLTREGPDGKIIPNAADSYEASEDGLTWTFHLNKNAKWSDGKPVLAKDFLYAFRRLANPATGSAYGDYLGFGFVKNAGKVFKGEVKVEDLGVAAIDDYTFQIYLDQPCPWLDSILTMPTLAPVRQDVVEKYGEKAFTVEHGVTNGPYSLKEYRLNDTIVLEKRKDYHGAKDVTLTKATYIFINDPTTSYYKYLNHDTDNTPIPPQLIDSVKQEKPNEVVIAKDRSMSYININMKRKGLDDLRVRRAIALLTNNKFIVDKILKIGTPSTVASPSYVNDAQLAKEADYFTQPLKDRYAEAKKLLNEAGYNKDNPLELKYLIGKDPISKRMFVAQQATYKQETDGALVIEPETAEWKVFLDKLYSGKYDLAPSGWGADYNQASTFYNLFICNASSNHSGYCSKEYDGYIEAAAKSADANKRAEYYAKAQEVLHKDLPTVVLFWKAKTFLQNPKIKNYNASNDKVYLRDLYLVK